MCLTRDALFRLLNNHGPDFGEQWEVPVWVKLNPGKGKTSAFSSHKPYEYLKTASIEIERI